jgi:hypothetical protein
MSRYYLHLRDHSDELLDLEGVELPDIQALKKSVLDAARGVLSDDLKSEGVVDLRYRIDAEDQSGAVVHTLTFKNAFRLIPELA